MPTRLRIATAGAGLLLIGGSALSLATSSAAAAPLPSATSTPTVAPSTSPSAPTLSATPEPSRPVLLPGVSAPPTTGIEVPAGNAGVQSSSDGSTRTVAILLGAGGLLVVGGATVAIRRRA